MSDVTIEFNRSNTNWSDQPNANAHFINGMMRYMDGRRMARGYVYLNDVLDVLGINRIPEGSVVGWYKKPIDWTPSWDDLTIWLTFKPESPEHADPRTDHSDAISSLRTLAKQLETERLSLIAASDLLELHDSTGINLHQAPRLLEFVESIAGITVEDNEA